MKLLKKLNAVASVERCGRKESHSWPLGTSPELSVRPWYPPVKHEEFHRTSTSDKATQWPWLIKAKWKPLHNHIQTQTRYEHCPGHKISNIYSSSSSYMGEGCFLLHVALASF